MKIETWLLPTVIEIAKNAGKVTLEYFHNRCENLTTLRKKDNTLQTKADLHADDMIELGLNLMSDPIPILSEEKPLLPFEARRKWSSYWLVDPLDGTRGFIEGCEEYTVNIALIQNQQSTLGVIYAPVLDICYYAVKGAGAFRQEGEKEPTSIHTALIKWPKLRVVLGRYLSKPKLLRMYEQNAGNEILRLNSSLKSCWIAEGRADIYPRLGETGEWDTAASQCILEEAGGIICDFTGTPLKYNLRENVINPPFIALGDPSVKQKVIEFIQEKRRNL